MTPKKPSVARLEQLTHEFGGTLAKVIVFQGMDLPTEKVEEQKRELAARQYESIRKQCELIEQKIAKLFRGRRTNKAKDTL